jgi:predicted AlkP superfamily pyrophosphatase or phosphodiesterase
VVARNLWRFDQPVPDAATLALTKAAIDALELGAANRTDYLAVSFSQTDPVGHDYGPTSLEQLDNVLRVDRLLGELLSYLDERVGEGRWLLALSADHGVMIEPEVRAAAGQPGLRFPVTELRALVDGANAAAGTGAMDEVRKRAAARMEESPAVADVMTEDELRSTVAPQDSFIELQRRSWFEGRQTGWLGRSGLWIRFTEGTIVAYPRGSTHGSAYWYDRHVPLIFYGAGVRSGQTEAAARTVDVAPTLARLIGIPYPEDIDGRPLAVPRQQAGR